MSSTEDEPQAPDLTRVFEQAIAAGRFPADQTPAPNRPRIAWDPTSATVTVWYTEHRGMVDSAEIVEDIHATFADTHLGAVSTITLGAPHAFRTRSWQSAARDLLGSTVWEAVVEVARTASLTPVMVPIPNLEYQQLQAIAWASAHRAVCQQNGQSPPAQTAEQRQLVVTLATALRTRTTELLLGALSVVGGGHDKAAFAGVRGGTSQSGRPTIIEIPQALAQAAGVITAVTVTQEPHPGPGHGLVLSLERDQLIDTPDPVGLQASLPDTDLEPVVFTEADDHLEAHLTLPEDTELPVSVAVGPAHLNGANA